MPQDPTPQLSAPNTPTPVAGDHVLPAWALSAIAHATVLFVFSLILFVSALPDEEPLPLRPAIIDTTPPRPPTAPATPIEKPQVLVPQPPIDDPVTAPHHQIDVSEVSPSTTEDFGDDAVANGRPTAISSSDMGNDGAFMAIGAGGGATGPHGQPFSHTRIKRIHSRISGSTAGSENAVDSALRWFKKHQSPNGQWDVDGYVTNCAEAAKCEPGDEHTDAAGDVACTAYALLCYLGRGYDHRMPSRYRLTVKKGLDWLLSMQEADGSLGARNYEHAIAAMALAEAYGMANDLALRAPAQRAVDRILARQASDSAGGYGLAWDYAAPNRARQDSSVTGWNVMALKSAAGCGLSVGNGLEGAKRWLDGAWKAANPDHAKLDPYATSSFPYTWNADSGQVDTGAPGSGHKEMACVGAVCAVFLGHRAGDVTLETLTNYVVQHQSPRAYPCNTYYLYYNTIAVFQVGGPRWTAWRDAMLGVLLPAQRAGDDCFTGSWDSAGTVFPGHRTGRLLSTAYNCLCLEVFYRNERIGGGRN